MSETTQPRKELSLRDKLKEWLEAADIIVKFIFTFVPAVHYEYKRARAKRRRP